MVLGRCPGSKKTKGSGTSSSSHVRHLYASRSNTGRSTLRQEILNATSISKRQASDREEYTLRRNAMSTAERDELNAICSNSPNDYRNGSASVDNRNLQHDAWAMDVDDILAGAETMDISHAGGEFASVVDIADGLLGPANR